MSALFPQSGAPRALSLTQIEGHCGEVGGWTKHPNIQCLSNLLGAKTGTKLIRNSRQNSMRRAELNCGAI